MQILGMPGGLWSCQIQARCGYSLSVGAKPSTQQPILDRSVPHDEN
jgi:hypothetical protein